MLREFTFFFNDTATTEIYTLSLHDALPIFSPDSPAVQGLPAALARPGDAPPDAAPTRSEEHTSELQSRQYLVCRLLLEKTKATSQSTRRSPQGRDAGKTTTLKDLATRELVS